MDKFNLSDVLFKINNGVFVQIGVHDGISNDVYYDQFSYADKIAIKKI